MSAGEDADCPVTAPSDFRSPPEAAERGDGACVRSPVFGEQHLSALEQAFRLADTDEDAALDRSELQDMWRSIFPSMKPAEIRDMTDDIFQDLDPNGDGVVSLGELRRYLLAEGGSGAELTSVDVMLRGDTRKGAPKNARELVWACIELDAPRFSRPPQYLKHVRVIVTCLSQAFILVSVTLIILESLPQYQNDDGTIGTDATFTLESTCVGFFTLEFVIRLIVAPDQGAFWESLWTWIDVFSIFPYYFALPIDGGRGNASGGVVVLRVMRVLRLLRAVKLGRGFTSVRLMTVAIDQCLRPVAVLMVFIYSVVACMSGSLMHVAELDDAHFNQTLQKWVRDADSTYSDAGTEIFFQTIPEGVWFALVTLTTVGYGDMYPITRWGRVVAACTMVVGPVVLACPLTLISSSYAEVTQEMEHKKRIYERRALFKNNIERSRQLAMGAPVSILKLTDLRLSMPVVHQSRGLGHVENVCSTTVTVRYDRKQSCWDKSTHTYNARAIREGKLSAQWGSLDFCPGMPVSHVKGGNGCVVEASKDMIEVLYDSGQLHVFRADELVYGDLRPGALDDAMQLRLAEHRALQQTVSPMQRPNPSPVDTRSRESSEGLMAEAGSKRMNGEPFGSEASRATQRPVHAEDASVRELLLKVTEEQSRQSRLADERFAALEQRLNRKIEEGLESLSSQMTEILERSQKAQPAHIERLLTELGDKLSRKLTDAVASVSDQRDVLD
eukprot:TRINITY_DN36263_c0_g1_i1.p1 TRINITY_DN36263_c0_g1~~TRINITY_DN36263_c0_g1_i1.p1  ORF type:complete len:728 (+),score=82.81 TRINITY_DN36263_c0_g1_i1:100-2283(+)